MASGALVDFGGAIRRTLAFVRPESSSWRIQPRPSNQTPVVVENALSPEKSQAVHPVLLVISLVKLAFKFGDSPRVLRERLLE